jgi:[ribosomal protein S5]-alanine N-acetyltransferase
VEPECVTGEVQLRLVTEEDAEDLSRAYVRNREHLRRWEPPRRQEFFTPAGQASRLRQQLAEHRAGRLVPWLLIRRGAIVGAVTLSSLVLGPFRNASLGYWVDGEHTGRGLATAAVHRVCAVADRHLRLHRIEAATATDNTPSQHVLAACGFEVIGLARAYLYVDGAWRDHLLFQRVLNDRQPETGGDPPDPP